MPAASKPQGTDSAGKPAALNGAVQSDIAKNEKDSELRKKAIFWLGQSRDPRVQQFLMDLINR